MMTRILIRNTLLLTLSMGALALSACSTQGSSRYGGEAMQTGSVPCGTVMVPCGYVVETRAVTVTPRPYLVPAPCPPSGCLAPDPQPLPPPVVTAPPEPAEPLPPVTLPEPTPLPPMPLPPIRTERPVVDDPPVIPCPEGTIPGYGGIDCIPITVSRK